MFFREFVDLNVLGPAGAPFMNSVVLQLCGYSGFVGVLSMIHLVDVSAVGRILGALDLCSARAAQGGVVRREGDLELQHTRMNSMETEVSHV